jgi:hypothetical protein
MLPSKIFGVRKSSNKHTMRVRRKETKFAYFGNSGVRVEVLRGEALFFLDFL